MPRAIPTVALILSLLFPAFVLGAPLESITIDNVKLTPNGSGYRRASIFRVKIYKAVLFTEHRMTTAEQVLEDGHPKFLRSEFVRDVDLDNVRHAWRESFAACNPDAISYKDDLEKFIADMFDVKEGLIVDITFHKDGVEWKGNGKGDFVPGAGFSKALLRIWFGPKPADEQLTQGLLSGSDLLTGSE